MRRLFNRNKKTTIAELEEYYANQDRRKTRTGRAWLMAILSLFITLATIALLFFGGRLLYRTLTGNDSTTTSSNSDNSGVDLPTFDGDVVGQGNSNSDNDSSSVTKPTTENAGVVSDEAAITSIPNIDRVSTTGSTAGNDIPNTGAGEVLIALPAVLAITGYFVSRRRMIKNS